MNFLNKSKQKLFITFAFLFALASIYHLAAVFFKIHPDVSGSSAARNILFVIINFICVYGMLKRPAWFIYCFPALLVQQLYSHGSGLINSWNEKGKMDWLSLIVVLILPVIMFFLIKDLKRKKIQRR